MTAQPVHPDAIIAQYRRRRVIAVILTTILWFVLSASIAHLCYTAWQGDPTSVKSVIIVTLFAGALGQFFNARDIVRLARS